MKNLKKYEEYLLNEDGSNITTPGMNLVKKYAPKDKFLYIDGKSQKMYYYKHGKLVEQFEVSTGKNGFGNEQDSGKTPTGLKKISSKFGEGLPKSALIVGRKGVKKKDGSWLTLHTCDAYARRIARKIKQYIPKQIIGWLPGEISDYINETEENCEAHVLTRGLVIDETRSIYIHGTNYENSLGSKPLSGGCIRVSNDTVIGLYNEIPIGTKIFIDPIGKYA